MKFANYQYMTKIFQSQHWRRMTPRASAGETCSLTNRQENTPTPKPRFKIQDKYLELSNVDFVSSNVKSSRCGAMLYTVEDNEAVIKMIIKGRIPTMRHVSRTHRVALDWLFDRIYLYPKIHIKYVDTKHQLADMFTKGNFTRDEWNHLIRLFNGSNFSSASCLQALSKRTQEETGEERVMAKSRLTMSLKVRVHRTARRHSEHSVEVWVLLKTHHSNIAGERDVTQRLRRVHLPRRKFSRLTLHHSIRIDSRWKRCQKRETDSILHSRESHIRTSSQAAGVRRDETRSCELHAKLESTSEWSVLG